MRRHGFALTPGLIDAGFASLAGFGASLYAARVLDPSVLGVYGLHFAAFTSLGHIPNKLPLLPASVASLDFAPHDRLSILGRTLPRGGMVALLAATLVAIPSFIVRDEVDATTLTAFGLTTAAMVILSPLQDHMRSVMYLANRPWSAATVSGVQFAAAMVVIGLMHGLQVPSPWIPFGGLAAANATSLGAGLLLVRRTKRVSSPSLPPMKQLFGAGATLLGGDAFPAIATFGTVALVATLASTEALGHAEAARVVASPAIVLGAGISKVLNPRFMEGGRRGSRTQVINAATIFVPAVVTFTAVYLVIVGWSHPWNPMEVLVPTAYEANGLVAFRLFALTFATLAWLPVQVLLGAGANRDILLTSVAASSARLGTTALLAPIIGAYALPAGTLAQGLAGGQTGLLRARRLLRRSS